MMKLFHGHHIQFPQFIDFVLNKKNKEDWNSLFLSFGVRNMFCHSVVSDIIQRNYIYRRDVCPKLDIRRCCFVRYEMA